MKSWFGSYHSSQMAEPQEATVLASEKSIRIGFQADNGPHMIVDWDMRDIEAGFDQSMQATRINKKNDRHNKLFVEGKDALQYIESIQAEYNKPWHKKAKTKNQGRGLLIVGGILAVLVGVYFLIVPWLSEKMADAISVDTEEQFGDAVYDALQGSMQENKEATALLNDFFRNMNMPGEYNIRITAVKSSIVNAFALPGGHIVVYTALLKELQTYPELAALLSHEFIHINNRHATRTICRQLGSRVFLSLLLGRSNAVTSIMVDQADNLKSLSYSRKLETEADLEGLSLLKERKIDPRGFIFLFQHLKTSGTAHEPPELLASHPDINGRITQIQEASAGTTVEENIQLKTIFDKLKTTEP